MRCVLQKSSYFMWQEAEAQGLGKVNVRDVEAVDEETLDYNVTESRVEFRHHHNPPLHSGSVKLSTPLACIPSLFVRSISPDFIEHLFVDALLVGCLLSFLQ